MVDPVRPRARRHPAVQRLHAPAQVGLRGHPAGPAIRCCCTTTTTCCTRARSSSRPTSCSRMYLCGDRCRARSRRRATSTTTRASPCATRRCRRRSRRSSRPRSATSSSPGTTSPRPRSSTCATWRFNTRDGVHLAALAGVWHAVVAGFGGMRDYGDTLAFAPRLPAAADPPQFRLLYRGRRLRVEVNRRPGHLRAARRRAARAHPPRRAHHGRAGYAAHGPVPPAPQYPQPHAPAGRQPGFLTE